ncbi:benzoate/H(+) symporter BenE family transporter [Pseudogemmobacter humi]|uniref:Inner membrane protein YdcO n=1 Tax=Pseudogemmobacter humi TaxID=2483812 RepID=A0A3P5XEK8_9RHOB|nr:benzoate/H(+) symporter BenE family transporter [Pseudogemmobacter humi]VDC33231.1 Inner membrane protein YdcO [Pseudogemmobacter humi]
MRISLVSAALVAALVGYGSSIAILLAAAAAVGASEAQTASWLLAICLAKAAGSLFLSLRHRVPVVLAWSTPGAALIAASEGVSMAQAVGAFVLAGLLVALTGVIRPLGRLIAMIPDAIAAGMLAGVLLPFCLRGMAAAGVAPLMVLPMVAVFALVRLANAPMAVLAALAAGLALAFGPGAATWPGLALPLPGLVFIAPEISPGVLIGLGLPLYLVTMASQNLPGFAVMRAAGYEPPVNSALGVTGGLSALSGLFGAHGISMAAITAAICLGPEVHTDRAERWKVGVVYAAVWVVLGLTGPLILRILAALPAEVMAALVALALLGPLTGALTAATAAPPQRFAAVMTLAVTASGVALLGIGAAFWGLAAGLALYAMERAARKA